MEKRVRTRVAGRGLGHPPTRDKGKNHNAETEQQVCHDQYVLCDDNYKAGLASARTRPDPGLQEEGALQPRLVSLRVHEGGVHEPVHDLLVERDAVGELHRGSTKKKKAIWTRECSFDHRFFHPSSVPKKSLWLLCKNAGGLLPKPGYALPQFLLKIENASW